VCALRIRDATSFFLEKKDTIYLMDAGVKAELMDCCGRIDGLL